MPRRRTGAAAAVLATAAVLAGCSRGPGVGGRAYCDALERVVERGGALTRPNEFPTAAAARRLAAAVGEVANAAPAEVAPSAVRWRDSLQETAAAIAELENARRHGRSTVSAIAVSFGADVDLAPLAESARARCGVSLPFTEPAAAVEPPVVSEAPASSAPGVAGVAAGDTEPTLPVTTVPPAGTPTVSVRVAYVGFATGPGGGLQPVPVDVRVGSDPLHLGDPVLSGIPGPYVSDPIVLPAGDVGYDVRATDAASDMLRYQGNTAGLSAGTQLVLATLRLPTNGDVTFTDSAEVGTPSLGQARLGFVLLWPDGSTVHLRPGLPGEGCLATSLVSGGPFSDVVAADVAPGRLEVALFAEDDTTCSGPPVIGPALVGAPAGTSTVLVGWRADDVNKGLMPVPLTGS